ncbi:MAG: acyltransferase [Ferruginibacter sp.]|nr:N-acetyltransferase [Ferruginibacter sp.]
MINVKIHDLADVHSQNIGERTQIWQFAIVLKDAIIGQDCNINCHTFIENNVKIGDRVTVKSGIYIWDGIIIADDVFLGPNVTFVNDKYPRSKQYPERFQSTIIEKSVSVGANATILGGIQIGEYALIAAGSVVTKSVPAFALVMGNPARIKGKVDKNGKVIERF